MMNRKGWNHQTIFEKSHADHQNQVIESCELPVYELSLELRRYQALHLPKISENEICRHFTGLEKNTYGVNDGCYPLGSCTMKYNSKLSEQIAALPGFSQIHPLQPADTVQGCLWVYDRLQTALCQITGMDCFTLQPAAGAHGEFTGLLMIKAYHKKNHDTKRTKILIPDSAHGTNPASAAMAGYTVVTIPSGSDGCVDMEALKHAANDQTAGLMLTNPNTVGLFDKNILQITQIIHDCGGLTYYDGANLNAILGIARPGDMGFDVMHVNLHKTFGTPHGGGGPGSGPVGCKSFLKEFLPLTVTRKDSVQLQKEKPKPEKMQQQYECSLPEEEFEFAQEQPADSIGPVKSFYGNFSVIVKAMTYVLLLGRNGLRNAGECAVLNANYMKSRLSGAYDAAYDHTCMHEFVLDLSRLKSETGVSALDIAKGLLDFGIHPPTMYFPLIVHEALMIEPTETEPKESLDQVVDALLWLQEQAYKNPEQFAEYPKTTSVGRLDEVKAARSPKLRYEWE